MYVKVYLIEGRESANLRKPAELRIYELPNCIAQKLLYLQTESQVKDLMSRGQSLLKVVFMPISYCTMRAGKWHQRHTLLLRACKWCRKYDVKRQLKGQKKSHFTSFMVSIRKPASTRLSQRFRDSKTFGKLKI